MDSQTNQMTDHDLLLLLNQAVKDLRREVASMNDGTNRTVSDHETRIRQLESFKWLMIGGLIIAQVVSDFIIYHFIH